MLLLVSLNIIPIIKGKLITIGTIYLKYVFTGPTTHVHNNIKAGNIKGISLFLCSVIKYVNKYMYIHTLNPILTIDPKTGIYGNARAYELKMSRDKFNLL